jgi:hypothetical protein
MGEPSQETSVIVRQSAHQTPCDVSRRDRRISRASAKAAVRERGRSAKSRGQCFCGSAANRLALLETRYKLHGRCAKIDEIIGADTGPTGGPARLRIRRMRAPRRASPMPIFLFSTFSSLRRRHPFRRRAGSQSGARRAASGAAAGTVHQNNFRRRRLSGTENEKDHRGHAEDSDIFPRKKRRKAGVFRSKARYIRYETETQIMIRSIKHAKANSERRSDRGNMKSQRSRVG